MTEKQLRKVLKGIGAGENVTNEQIFTALRVCEGKLKTCNNLTYQRLWERRVAALKNLIVTQNGGLVHLCIVKAGCRTDDDDMVREANLALTRSIRCYDINRGFKWSTYVTNAMTRALWTAKSRKRNIPYQLDETNLPEFVQEYDLPLAAVGKLRDILVDNAAELSLREIEILDLRFFQGWKLKLIAEKFNLSRERIRQILESSFTKIRNLLEPEQTPEVELPEEVVEVVSLQEVAA